MALISNLEDSINVYKNNIFDYVNSIVECIYGQPVQKLYSISTEISKNFLLGVDLHNKTILTVGSSGDQIFEYILRGSKDITVMDGNPLTPYFCELKHAAIKTLNCSEYNAFFRQSNYSEFMNRDTYLRIRKNIDNEDVITFWDFVFAKKREQIKRLFHLYDGAKPNYFANEKNYGKVRRMLSCVKVKFYYSSLSSFYEYAKKEQREYDLIDLSNIITYASRSEEGMNEYRIAVKKLHRFLSKNGMLKLDYCDSRKPLFSFLDKVARKIFSSDEGTCFIVWDNDSDRYNPDDSITELSVSGSISRGGRK